MSTNTVDNKRKVTTARLTEMKARGEKISMLTAYDYSTAILVDGRNICSDDERTCFQQIHYLHSYNRFSCTARKDNRSKSCSRSFISDKSNVPAGIGDFKLSPDESKVMYVSYIHSDVKQPSDTDPKLDKATAYVAEDLMYRHWDHWVTELPHTFIADFGEGISPEKSIDILASEDKLYELPTEPFGGMEQLDWSPDGKYIAYSCKKKAGKEYAFSTNTEIYIYNVADGSCNVIPMGGGYDTEPTWSPDGQHIAWLSMARDGYEADKTRLMVADVADGKAGTIRDLTAGFKYNAAAPVWDDDSRTIYFNALAEGLQGIFKANVDGTISRITSDSQWCDYNSPFAVQKSDKGTTLLASWCSMDFPTELVSVSAEDGSTVQITKENEHILSQLADHKMEARMVKTVDGKDMLTWVMYPPQFDSTKVYPSILICLGGHMSALP